MKKPQIHPGTYRDRHGEEQIEWRFEPLTLSRRDRLVPAFDIHCTVRGVEVYGGAFDSLEVADPEAATAAGLTLLGTTSLTECVLSGSLTTAMRVDAARVDTALSFVLDLRSDETGRWPMRGLEVSLRVGGDTYSVTDDSFENCLEEIDAALPAGTRLECCLTCQWSAYQMYSTALLGMHCNRDAKEQHLAAEASNDKHRLNAVPTTEWVPENHWCPAYEVKDPPTSQQAHRSGKAVSKISDGS